MCIFASVFLDYITEKLCTHYSHIQDKVILKPLEGFSGGDGAHGGQLRTKKFEHQDRFAPCSEAKACKEVLKEIVIQLSDYLST